MAKKTPEEARQEAIDYINSPQFQSWKKGRFIFALWFAPLSIGLILLCWLFSFNPHYLKFAIFALVAVLSIAVRFALKRNQ